MTFRIHLSDGKKIDIDADNPAQAWQLALKRVGGDVGVVKIKRLRENK